MRVEHSRRPLRPNTLLLMVALIATWFAVERALAETPVAATPHTTTIIVFAQHRMPEGEWTDLLTELRKEAAEAAAETPPLRGAFEILRGDTVEK